MLEVTRKAILTDEDLDKEIEAARKKEDEERDRFFHLNSLILIEECNGNQKRATKLLLKKWKEYQASKL